MYILICGLCLLAFVGGIDLIGYLYGKLFL